MNVLSLVSKNLEKYGENWSLDEKIRYIYLQSCEYFTYDSRYIFADYIENGDALLNTIENRKYNLKDIQDNRAMCKNHTKEILSKMYEELLNVKVSIYGSGHPWLVVEGDKNDFIADATINNDLARVKMNLPTYGYKPMFKRTSIDWNDFLKRTDQSIGYIKDYYENNYIQNRADNLLEEYKNPTNEMILNGFDEQFFRYKLTVVKNMYESYSKIQSFSDSIYCIEYLLRKFLDKNELCRINIETLFINEEGNWDYAKIYTINLPSEQIYFVCRKSEFGYDFDEISYIEVTNICNNYQSINRR